MMVAVVAVVAVVVVNAVATAAFLYPSLPLYVRLRRWWW
jgi:hypothetical protein